MQSRKLGRYEIVKELGRGALGRVFLAYDPQIERQVAIETVQGFEALPEAERPAARARFLDQARDAGKVMHPGIVTLFDAGQSGEMLYVAMEHVEGTNLDAFCKPEALLPVKTVASLVATVAEALHYAHAAGLLHGDVEPANLLRVAEDRVKIMNLGLVEPGRAQRTEAGGLQGTPGYMAPEQIRGSRMDGRSDLFSLGIVLFELLTGERPFPGDSISSIVYRIVNEPPRRASEVNERVPAELDAFLDRALAKEPDRRFADGKQFAAALRHAIQAVPEVSRTEPVPVVPDRASASLRKKPERPPRTSPVPFVVVLVLALAGSGLGAYYFRERLGLEEWLRPREVLWQATVRTEPAGLPILIDGAPLDPTAQGVISFKPEGPFPTLSAAQGCRSAEHTLSPADAGGEVVLLLDPVELDWPLDLGIQGAAVSVNGATVGTGRTELRLDLCRDNRIEVAAAGFRPARLELPIGVTPLAGRTRLAGLSLEPIPRGRLELPEFDVDVAYEVDGRRLGKGERSLDLEEGKYEVRITNATYWIDASRTIEVVGGETVTSSLKPPPLATLVVQAFPANCKVDLRKPGGTWTYVDDTPLRKKLATGAYEVRVTLTPTREARVLKVDLVPGDNLPVRVSFGERR